MAEERLKRNNPEAEIQVLGNCIKSKLTFEKIKDKLDPEDFYSTNNKKLFKAINECYTLKESTDIVTFHDMLEKNEVVLTYAIDILVGTLELTDISPYVNELLNLRVNREIIELSNDIAKGVLKSDLDVRKRLEGIEFIKSKIGNDDSIITLDKVKIVDIYSLEKIQTGFKEIDEKLLGFAMGSLCIITGYNANGKSTLINQMCIAESLSQGYKVFAYSPELTNSNLKSWLYPTIANDEHFITKTYKDKKYRTLGNVGITYIDEWIKNKLFVYSDDSITSDESKLLLDMNRLANQGVRVFIIDNLMKIDLENSYKNEYMAQKIFVNKLKGFARKYNAIVHLVAHPKKPKEGSNKITKFDIAGSGDITNLADYVISISRVTDKDRKESIELYGKDAVIKVMKDRIKGNSEFISTFAFNSERKRFYSNENELNKDYGYTNMYDLVQVEMSKEWNEIQRRNEK